MRFEPRAVPAVRALAWVRSGVALTARAPLAFVALGLLPAVLLALPGRLGDAGFAALPLVLGTGAALARAIDEGGGVWGARVPFAACARLLCLGAAIALAALALVSALDAAAPAAGGWAAPAGVPNAVNAALADAARAAWFWTLALGPTLWFAPALLAIPALAFAPALLQGVHALVLNRFLVALWLTAAALWWLATVLPVLVVPLGAIHAATLWSGYRELWLGRGENLPRAARTAPRTAPRAGGAHLARRVPTAPPGAGAPHP